MTTRRNFLKLSAAGLGTGLLGCGPNLFAAGTDPDHFFLMIVLAGGADSSYMFDARPLSMTAAGKIQNYWSKNGTKPAVWTGTNGQTCLATPLIKPLERYQDRFSILNGVYMTPSFDGHEQNFNFLFTGSPFGGDSFVPHLNAADTGRASESLDAIQPGPNIQVNVSNHSRVVALEAGAVGDLAAKLRSTKPPTPGTELTDFIRARQQALSAGNGRFSVGSKMMFDGIDAAPGLHAKLIKLPAAKASDSEELQALKLIGESFKLRIARSAMLQLPEEFDVHSAGGAADQPALFTGAIAKVAEVFKFLETTPFDSTRSLFDVTTLMVVSEMGRTMRVNGNPIDQTGTNHNQFSNSLLIGGKGIKGKQVFGASDMPDENAPVSQAHKQMDPILEKLMGRPFDFATEKPRADLPAVFDIQHYLTVNTVVNSVYSLFGVPQAKMRTLGRNLPVAPVLKGLLS